MSSDVIERVCALVQKAEELHHKGQLLRANEKFSLAAEAARALGADNLVGLHMQLRQGYLLALFAVSAAADGASDARFLESHRAQCVALLAGAVAALERRRVAGTLLEGGCSAVEEAWRACQMQRLDGTYLPPGVSTARMARLGGYEEFLVPRPCSSCF